MVIPGLLIEYLMNGALALIWIMPLFIKLKLFITFKIFQNLAALAGASDIILLVIALYFTGMFVDIVAWVSTKYIKEKIRKQIRKKFDIEDEIKKGSSYRRQAKFAIYALELSKEASMRSSRDRIARGSIVNSLFGTIAFAIIFSANVLVIVVGLTSCIICIFMWKGFEEVSYGFELNAEKILDEKISKHELS